MKYFRLLRVVCKPAALTLILAFVQLCLFVNTAFCEFGESGWAVFKKIQSSQFKGIASSSPSRHDATGLLYNPAIPANLPGRELAVMSELGAVEDKFGCILYSHPLNRFVLSFGFAYYSAGSAELNWFDNGVLQSRDVKTQEDYMGIASIAVPFNKYIFTGLTVKSARSTIAETETAYAYSADAGIFLMPTADLSVSIAAQNMGEATKFIEESDPLPLTLYMGSSYRLRFSNSYILGSAGAGYDVENKEPTPEAGVELGFDNFSVQAGYRFIEGDLNMHFGMRLTAGNIVLGYSYIPSEYLNPMHRATIGYKFSRQQKPKKINSITESKIKTLPPALSKESTKPLPKKTRVYKLKVK